MLVAQSVAFDMIAAIKPLIDGVARHDRNLADQLRRAAQSVVLNIAEGARSQGRTEVTRYFSALGSTNETRAALTVACTWGFLHSERCSLCERHLDRLARLLWGLTHRRTQPCGRVWQHVGTRT